MSGQTLYDTPPQAGDLSRLPRNPEARSPPDQYPSGTGQSVGSCFWYWFLMGAERLTMVPLNVRPFSSVLTHQAQPGLSVTHERGWC